METISSGFYVAVTNNSNKPLIKYEGIEVAPGQVTNIGISKSFHYKLPSPYGKCSDYSDSKFYNYTISMGGYTHDQCYEVCFQYLYAIPNCLCADASVGSNVNNVTFCRFDTNQACLNQQRSSFTSSSCDSECPMPCERVEYSYKVSISKYPTE